MFDFRKISVFVFAFVLFGCFVIPFLAFPVVVSATDDSDVWLYNNVPFPAYPVTDISNAYYIIADVYNLITGENDTLLYITDCKLVTYSVDNPENVTNYLHLPFGLRKINYEEWQLVDGGWVLVRSGDSGPYYIFGFEFLYFASYDVCYEESWMIYFSGSSPVTSDGSIPPGSSSPIDPSFPGPLYPGPRGAQTPVWVKKLDVSSMPNFQVGGDPVTFEAQAYTNDGGTIFYKWRLSGQKWNDGGFIGSSETEYVPSSNGTKFQVPLTEEGLYSLTCIAYNFFYDEVSGTEFTSQITTCSITFTVTERESDPVPDTIKPPYEGWEDDMCNAQGLNKEIEDTFDNIGSQIDIIDSVTMPNIDDIDINVLDMIDGSGFVAMNSILSVFWNNNIILTVLTFAFVFAMIGFFIFGKR